MTVIKEMIIKLQKIIKLIYEKTLKHNLNNANYQKKVN